MLIHHKSCKGNRLTVTTEIMICKYKKFSHWSIVIVFFILTGDANLASSVNYRAIFKKCAEVDLRVERAPVALRVEHALLLTLELSVHHVRVGYSPVTNT